MLILSKTNGNVINTDHVTTFYLGANDKSIKADFIGGKGCQIGEYSNRKTAMYALRMVLAAYETDESFVMPEDEEISDMMSKNKIRR